MADLSSAVEALIDETAKGIWPTVACAHQLETWEVERQIKEKLVTLAQAVVEAYKSEWRPISEAPKDGTRLLLLRTGANSRDLITIGRWDNDGEDGYWSSGGHYTKHFYSIYEPTHWTPLLPAPPQVEEQT